MPMPHRTQMQLIKRRLVGKEGAERVRELRTILGELPNYRNGPYADIRKWVNAEIDATRTRAKVVHRDSVSVRREGAAQVALVGPPNAGKSSLLQALSSIQIKTGDYAFTTTRPVPALTRIGGVLVQLVEIPGLIAGASEDRGGGRALLGVLRGADAIVFCHAAGAPPEELRVGPGRGARGRDRAARAAGGDEGGRGAGRCARPAGGGLPGVRRRRRVRARRREPRRLPRARLGADRPDARLPRSRRRARRRPARAAPSGHRRRRRSGHPQRGGCAGTRRAGVGAVGALPRPARRPRATSSRTATSSRSSPPADGPAGHVRSGQ